MRTGLYRLTDFDRVLRAVVAHGAPVTFYVPASWARTSLPVLPPAGLKLVEVHAAPGTRFPTPNTFGVECGKQRLDWTNGVVTTMKQP